MLALHFVWRCLAFVWMPINLQTWPGACVEASAIASTSCLVTWLMLADAPLWWRIVITLSLFVPLRLSQVLGIYWHGWRLEQTIIPELKILSDVDYQAAACSLAAAALLRWLTGWRNTRSSSRVTQTNDEAPLQFKLSQLFLLTAIVAVLFGLARIKWQKQWAESYESILFLHASTIAVAVLPAILWLRPRLIWATLVLVIVWLVEPVAIAGYFQFAGWFPFEWEMIRHLITTVAGPAVTATMLALALRSAGYRLRSLPRATQQVSIGDSP